jgi:trans-aconitate methyltransferase
VNRERSKTLDILGVFDRHSRADPEFTIHGLTPMDWDAERYHRVSNPQLEWGRRVLRRLAPQPGERVLDIGCGTGRLTAELMAALGEGTVVAVDRSDAMLREASRQALAPQGPHRLHEQNGRVRACFVRADGAALPFVDAFDAVLSTATFHWILDHDQLFASVYRALAPGGRLVAQCGGGANLGRLLARATRLTASPQLSPIFEGWDGPWEFADVATTTMRLDRAGFTAIDVSLEPSDVTFPDRASFREFVSCVCLRDHVSRMPEALRPGFLDAIADEAAADDPPFTLDYWRLNLAAAKPAGAEQAA